MAVPVMKNVTIARYMVNESVAHTIEAMTNRMRCFALLLAAALAHIMREIAVSMAAMEISGPSNRNPNISAKMGEAT